jgi:WD40 repeat protein
MAILKDHKDSVLKVRFIQNGKYFISASGDYSINMYDSNTFELLKTFTGHEEIVNSLCFSHSENCIVSGSRDNTIKIWNINDTTFMKSF